MHPEIQGALIGAIIAAVAARILWRVQRQRKTIEYEVQAMSLLRFVPGAERVISVTVDDFALSGDEPDKGSFTAIDSAYAFRVTLFNTGNQTIENPVIEVSLDSRARIVEQWTEPAPRLGFTVPAKRCKSRPNVAHLIPQYLNPSEQLMIGLTSIENLGRECEVQAFGAGIQLRPRRTPIGEMCVGTFAAIAIMVIVALLRLTVLPRMPQVFSIIGGRLESTTSTYLVIPWWAEAIWFGFPFGLALSIYTKKVSRAFRLFGWRFPNIRTVKHLLDRRKTIITE